MIKQRINFLSLICNLANLILVTYCVMSFFTAYVDSETAYLGIECFRYFTVDSNILMALLSVMMLRYNIKITLRTDTVIPHWAVLCKYIGCVGVVLTFLTVLFFLGPTLGFDKAFTDKNIYLHLICPILAAVSFLFFEKGEPLGKTDVLLGILPTVLYGLVYGIMVQETGIWENFYGFPIGSKWWISAVGMLIAVLLIAWLLYRGNTKRKTIKEMF